MKKEKRATVVLMREVYEEMVSAWVEMLEARQMQSGAIATLRLKAAVPGDGNETRTVTLVVMLESDLTTVADMKEAGQ